MNITHKKKRKKQKKLSKRNKGRIFSESHTKTKKNKWFQEHRNLLNEIDNKDAEIELLISKMKFLENGKDAYIKRLKSRIELLEYNTIDEEIEDDNTIEEEIDDDNTIYEDDYTIDV